MLNWSKYNRYNNLIGWMVFAIATIVYLMTIGPTASLWDCAEFIACDYKLEIGHPPGAPFYMLVYNIATHLAPDVTKVALYANAMSGILSGFTILFLFWTITHMVRRVLTPTFNRENQSVGNISLGNAIAIYGSGIVGALVYTFSDTFWFSAVEAEVYAFSSFFTALVFWLIFVWEERSHEKGSDRWIILIAYLMGLSIGVHLLNLLCIPAMSMVVYYKKVDRQSTKKALLTLLVSFVLIVLMMYGIIQGVPKVGGFFDMLAVNTFGYSVNTGLYTYLILLALTLIISVLLFHREKVLAEKKKPISSLTRFFVALSLILMGIPFMGGVVSSLLLLVCIFVFTFGLKKISRDTLHLVQMCLVVIAIGFSSYGVILVRAMADPPMNENAPADAFSLRYYLAREQYGSKPLLYGPTFLSKPIDTKEVGTDVQLMPKDKNGKQEYKSMPKMDYKYAPEDMMLFPRIYSPKHASQYNNWLSRKEDDMSKVNFFDNITFALRYQINYMYWRYFLWNFSGRQNDLYGDGGLLRGNALTGIPFIDNLILGDQSTLPDSFKNNKGHNVYYMLPLLLGLLGICFQALGGKKNVESFWITMLLFLMTGLAIIGYLNQTPGEPRERDYAYAGSFYAYAIWIGFGVMAVYKIITHKLKGQNTIVSILVSLLLLFIPIQMASQNWDDHDRSGRTIARDMGINYLESCEPNSILFCYGDNDTFPLWYAQEVEGIRTDIRTVNTSYLSGYWYVTQQHKQAYQAKPIPYRYIKPSFYYNNQIAYVNNQNKNIIPLDGALRYMVENITDETAIIPGSLFSLPIDTIKQKTYLSKLDPRLKDRVISDMAISLSGKKYVDLSSLSVLDMILANNWDRPMYWAITSPRNSFTNLQNYQMQVGMASQLLPVDLSVTDSTDSSHMMSDPILIDRTYDVVMNKFRWCGAEHPNTYFDENCRDMIRGLRNNVIADLALALINNNDMERANEILDKCLINIKEESVPYTYRSLPFVEALYRAGKIKEADDITKKVGKEQYDMILWTLNLSSSKQTIAMQYSDFTRAVYFFVEYNRLSEKYGNNILKNQFEEIKPILKQAGYI